MKKFKTFETAVPRIARVLAVILENGKLYSAEGLAEQLKTDKDNIHRAFKLLCTKPGWSIRPVNQSPYVRRVIDGKRVRSFAFERKKGEQYNHDTHEPTWERTKFEVIRP